MRTSATHSESTSANATAANVRMKAATIVATGLKVVEDPKVATAETGPKVVEDPKVATVADAPRPKMMKAK